jgi:hypothetical protein
MENTITCVFKLPFYGDGRSPPNATKDSCHPLSR